MTITRRGHCAADTSLTVTPLGSPAGLCLRGEADILGADLLREAIAALPASIREVRLELAALSFIDVSCTRELLTLARRPARPCLILHQPPRSLIVLIRLLAPDFSQIPAPPGNSTGNGPTVSIQAA